MINSPPLEDILCAILGDNEKLNALPMQSKKQGEFFPAIRVPLSVAKWLQELDLDETSVHVELYATHGEVWRTFYWRESISRREALKEKLDAESAILRAEKAELENLAFHLEDHLGYTAKKAMSFARQILNSKNEQDKAMLLKLLNV